MATTVGPNWLDTILWSIAGVTIGFTLLSVVWFLWSNRKRIAFNGDPVLLLSTMLYFLAWLANGVLNGIGLMVLVNALFWLVPQLPGALGMSSPQMGFTENDFLSSFFAIATLVGFLPSIDQFRIQKDPTIIEDMMPGERQGVLIRTAIDGILCTAGFYFLFAPPQVADGNLYVPRSAFVLIVGLVVTYLISFHAQYEVHMRLYRIMGWIPPYLPGPWLLLRQLIGDTTADDEARKERAMATERVAEMRRRARSRTKAEPEERNAKGAHSDGKSTGKARGKAESDGKAQQVGKAQQASEAESDGEAQQVGKAQLSAQPQPDGKASAPAQPVATAQGIVPSPAQIPPLGEVEELQIEELQIDGTIPSPSAHKVW
jgi:hypothetical protein